ncbi:MAG TPA: CocE/NonD family hydrolase [Chitinophagaceae bacterium]|nr:CocE/NonD family hydrolase [Chitinophagaceae bacterium]
MKRITSLLLLLSPLLSFAQGDTDTGFVRNNYTKTESFIAMRDGIRLYTAIYAPKDTTAHYPILMQRTPYSCWPYGVANYRQRIGPNTSLMKDKYIFVYQDARGRYKSEGHFREMTPAIDDKKTKNDVDESSDTYDTIDWLLANTNSNGKVGIYGISFPGFYSSAALPDAHPALKAVSPQAPMSDEFIGDDCNHNGAFFLLDNYGFYSGFDGPKTDNGENYKPFFNARFSDAYAYFLKMGPLKNANTASFFYDTASTWRQVVAHDTYDDFWKSKNIKTHLKNIKPAVLIVGGWFDAEDMYGALKTYAAIEKQSPGNDSRLVMGPWTHGAWAAPSWKSFAAYQFGSDLNKYYQDEIETKFFEWYLKGKGSFDRPEVTLFETGSNEWKTYASWPPPNSQPVNYYLHANGKISTVKPAEAKSATEYISDPAKPVPYTSVISGRRNNEYMAEDQRFAAQRPDVLVFQADSLTEDMTLTGEIGVNLFVSMTGSDADFIVKLIDVWPADAVITANEKRVQMGGYQQMVRAEVFRGKFRNSYSTPQPFVKDKVEKVSFKLNEVAHEFKKGHRIMIQIQSSWFPLVDRNPQKFLSIPLANESDFQKATIRIHHDAMYASSIVLPVLK